MKQRAKRGEPMRAFLLLLSVLPLSAATYYVSSSTGNDSWSGLQPSPNAQKTDGPFRTLTKSQTAMRASSTVKTTQVRSGTYSINPVWTFSWQDANEAWTAYSGELPVLEGSGSGGITLNGANGISFAGFTIQNIANGGLGIYLSGGIHNLTIGSNRFLNCAGICIGGGGVTNSVIDSNTFNGETFTGMIVSDIEFWYGSSGNRITNNVIKNAAGGGIQFSAGTTDRPNNSNIVDHNTLMNVCTAGGDWGAIYMADRSHTARGNQITNNTVMGNGGPGYATSFVKAFYIDDEMSNVIVSGNVCSMCGRFAFQIHGGDHVSVINNVFDLNSAGTLLGLYQSVEARLPAYGMQNNLIQGNQIYLGSSMPMSLYQVNLTGMDALPTSKGNRYCALAGGPVPNTGIVDTNPIMACGNRP